MTLDAYRRPRMIVLSPRSTAYEAARAMADNHVGAVLVCEEQQVVGIVTDRDLALDVVAGDLDPRGASLRAVMSDEVACCEVSGSIDDAARLMRERGVRRIPITEDGRPVGLVTLDDLVVDGAVDIETVRSIVERQLEAPARFKAEGEIHPTEPARAEFADGRTRARLRRLARAENTYRRLLRAVERHSGLGAIGRAELALDIVLGMICRRLTPQEARHLLAQLPSKLQPSLEPFLDGPDKRITTELIEAELRARLGLDEASAASVLRAVCDAIAESVSAGEIDEVRGQLPRAMKDLFPRGPAAPREQPAVAPPSAPEAPPIRKAG